MKANTVKAIFLVAVVLFLFSYGHGVLAVGQTGDYLNYQEPKAAGTSVLSTIGYLISLLFTFAFVIGLAYLSSRFIGQKMVRTMAVGGDKVLSTLPLGPNRGVYIVDVAGKVLILGVTDQNVNLIHEVTDPLQTDRLRNSLPEESKNQFDRMFQRQLTSLQHMSRKFPGVFGGYNRNENE
jgi:flagellar protein FliO/FliZ